MKDEEFKTKLESILKTFYDTDREVKKYLDEKKPVTGEGYYKAKPSGIDEQILDDKYKA